MATPNVVEKRLNYFTGQFLQEQDFKDEQAYHMDRQRHHARYFHSPGIVEGLTVGLSQDRTSVQVQPGTAIDDLGRLIIVKEEASVPLLGQDVAQHYIELFYDEKQQDLASVGKKEFTRWEEKASLSVGSGSAGSHAVWLARLTMEGQVVELDLSVRRQAGVRLSDYLRLYVDFRTF